MSKKHDENKDLKSFSRIGRVVPGDKTLRASKSAIIGIHLWGKIDFLTKYCGWFFVWDNSSGTIVNNDSSSTNVDKKTKKEHSLTNKKSKRNAFD